MEYSALLPSRPLSHSFLCGFRALYRVASCRLVDARTIRRQGTVDQVMIIGVFLWEGSTKT